MIAADSSAWIDYFSAKGTENAKSLELALQQGHLVVPLPVQFELLSGSRITPFVEEKILRLPVLELVGGFWERAAGLRRDLLRKGTRARAMDCLIAQNCIDSGVPLIAEDKDFKKFERAGLKLV